MMMKDRGSLQGAVEHLSVFGSLVIKSQCDFIFYINWYDLIESVVPHDLAEYIYYCKFKKQGSWLFL